ncbi:unnamed protein product [Closterium sp. Naga37s-1]|nr:unnamed protein product [Closterium sp. Naga37s-1]
MLARSAALPSLRSSSNTSFVSAVHRASRSTAALPPRPPLPALPPSSVVLPTALSLLGSAAARSHPATPAIAFSAAVRQFRRSASQSVRAMASGDESAGLVATHGEDSCIFCKIVDGKIPSHKVWETEHALAILDAFPMARGHTLIIPKKHISPSAIPPPFLRHPSRHPAAIPPPSLRHPSSIRPPSLRHLLTIPLPFPSRLVDMPEEESVQLLKLLPAVSKAVRTATGAEGVNIFQNNGGPAGQVVFHVHVHVLPRTEADGLLSFGKSGPMIAAEEAKEIKEAIAAALPSNQ